MCRGGGCVLLAAMRCVEPGKPAERLSRIRSCDSTAGSHSSFGAGAVRSRAGRCFAIDQPDYFGAETFGGAASGAGQTLARPTGSGLRPVSSLAHSGAVRPAVRFSQGDIKTIYTWLESQGFKIVEVPASRNLIVFRGTVQTVQSAFRTSIHEYVVGGERHIANSTAPSLPAALEPLVLAI